MEKNLQLRKAAIVMLSMDKAKATKILNLLPRDQVERLTMEIAKTNDVSSEDQDASIKEFLESLGKRTVIERGSLDLAGELLAQSLGKEAATSILNNVKKSMESVPFGFLQRVSGDDLFNFLSDEHPQTIALILSYLPTNLAADVLGKLPTEKQLDVVRRIANMEQTNPEIVKDIEASLESRMKVLFSQDSERTGGVPLVAQILNVSNRDTSKGILDALGQESADLATDIQRLMFVFDDIVKLDRKAIQAILKEVEVSMWAMALKGASEELKEKIFGSLAARASENLKEEMSMLGKVKFSEVEAKQQAIVDVVRKLENAGIIEVASGDGERLVQ